MKTHVTRILSLMLALLLVVSLFAGCGDNEESETVTDVQSVVSTLAPVIVEVDEDDPYTIAQSKDGKDIVILTPNADGSITMTVAENTTLETFFTCVVAKEGYAIKITDAEGKEVVDQKTVIAKGMVFEVYKDGEDSAKVTLIINVITQEKIKETIDEQKEIDKNNANSQILGDVSNVTENNHPENSLSSKNPSKGDNPNQRTIDIVLSSIFGESLVTAGESGKAWHSTFKNMERTGIYTTVAPLDVNSATDIIVKEVMAGKASADVFNVSLVMCRNIARKKAAANIYESKTLERSLYDTAVTDSLTFGGKAFGVAFPAMSVNPMGVIYNKELIKKYAPDYDIIKLYNSKKWNFDSFQKLAKLCTVDTDGNGKTDIYGFTSNTNIIGMALTANAGGTALMKNGRVEATMCSDAGIAALEWCKAMFKNDKSWKYQGDIGACYTSFANGEAAMFVSYLHFYKEIAKKADFKFGFVLMPMGPDQKQYNNGVYDGACFVVPNTKKDRLADIGLWLNGVASVSGKLINAQLVEYARNGLDSTSQSIYKWLVHNMTPEFSSGPFSGDVASAVDSSVTVASKSPAKIMNSIKIQAQKECDDYYGPLY